VAIVKVTEKGQVTLPVELRRKLHIGKDDYLVIEAEGSVLKVRKLSEKKLLATDDPIWDFVGQHASGKKEISVQHDRFLAEGERKRWRKR
jgi:transcriptional pleiotropic regulator of transition state genes